MKQLLIITVIILLTLLTGSLFGQGKPYEGPDDPAGDISAMREGWMTGNRVLLYFQNNTELSDWPESGASRWPNDYKGIKIIDGVCLIIGVHVYVENDSIPVTNQSEISSRTDLEDIYFVVHAFREKGSDKSADGTIPWELYPVFGYFNEYSEYPAMSNRPGSWPPLGWPSKGDNLKWEGEWNGRFGRGVQYADLETYFVANDAQDQEYLQPSRREQGLPLYYPRPGVLIGDKKADVTIQNGKPWGGAGIRTSVRGYQWNNPQTRDAIFFEYDISNISDYDLPELAFGYDVRSGIGDDGSDDMGFFETKLDMAYTWDLDGVGKGGLLPGTMGMAYLESPGSSEDKIDNDEDGLLDEKRDNQAQNKIGPTDGISNLEQFMDWYGFKSVDQLSEHWDADEDQDWSDGEDLNNNGVYDLGENPGDDVGLDGVGPGELNYTGPDLDGTECNHMPDFIEGIGCEPNFAATDVSESDMIGLTAFQMRNIGGGRIRYGHDKDFYTLYMSSGELKEWLGSPTNLSMVFASGVFSLKQGRTERISMSMVHSYEALSGLNTRPR